MKIALIVLLAIVIAAGVSFFFMRGLLSTASATPTKASEGSLWAMKTTALDGSEADLSAYAGQVALVVNVASKCGLTPQYEGLEALFEERKKDGLVILGFPSNDFMGQEPGTAEEIRSFCSTNYGVSFPLMAKVQVKGDGRNEIYNWLIAGGLEEPTWNFTKYLVGRDGKVLARFAPRTKPDDPEMLAAIDAALKTEAP
jgi:glutathione peroxidase